MEIKIRNGAPMWALVAYIGAVITIGIIYILYNPTRGPAGPRGSTGSRGPRGPRGFVGAPASSNAVEPLLLLVSLQQMLKKMPDLVFKNPKLYDVLKKILIEIKRLSNISYGAYTFTPEVKKKIIDLIEYSNKLFSDRENTRSYMDTKLYDDLLEIKQKL